VVYIVVQLGTKEKEKEKTAFHLLKSTTIKAVFRFGI
jgi:hypothetical protein